MTRKVIEEVNFDFEMKYESRAAITVEAGALWSGVICPVPLGQPEELTAYSRTRSPPLSVALGDTASGLRRLLSTYSVEKLC